MAFDPIERSFYVENVVMSGNKRKYYRFRHSLHYGGIVTADAVGCNLLCAYCWNYGRNLHPERFGEFHTPQEVAQRLTDISKKVGYDLFRVSGAEPILGERSAQHLVEVMRLVGGPFILETNGLMFGYKPDLVDLFVGLNVSVRVSVKGWDEESFEKVTGAKGEFFEYQLRALEALHKRRIRFWVAVMDEVFKGKGLERLRRRLPVPCRIEREPMEKYSFVVENMKKRGLLKQGDS